VTSRNQSKMTGANFLKFAFLMYFKEKK